MYDKYSLFIVAIIAIYAATMVSWNFFRPNTTQDLTHKQFEILRQSDQFLSSTDNVAFKSITTSNLTLNTTHGNRLLGVNAAFQVVPIDLRIDLDKDSIQYNSINLKESLSIGDTILSFSTKDPTLRIEHSLSSPFIFLKSFATELRNTSMLTLTTETQIDPLNGCFVNLMCNQASTYRVTGDGSHIFHSYYDKPVLDLFTHTTASRVSPCIRLAQDSNTSPFLQCCQETVPQFTVHSNGNLRWGSQWYLHTNNTSLTIGSNTTTLLSIASNGDTQITGNTRLIGNVNMGTSDGASTTTVVGTMMIKGSSNSALDTPLNPSAYNSVMLMEDGVGPTLRAGYVQGHATKESGYIRLVPGTSNKTGQLIYRGHPGNSFTVEFDARFGDEKKAIVMKIVTNTEK
jgi:hypothetical protein